MSTVRQGQIIRLAVSLAVLAGALRVGYTTTWALSVQEEHLDDPTGIYSVGGENMQQRRVLLDVLLPVAKIGRWKHALLAQNYFTLWAALYVVASLLGWCGSIWYRLVIPVASPLELVPSLFLGGLSGLFSFGLIRLLSNAPQWAHTGWSYWLILPLLAGFFLATFFEKAEGLLRVIMDAIQKLIGKATGGLWLVVSLSVAVQAAEPAEPQTVEYYRCLEPAGTRCIALTKSDQAQCSSCTKWEKKAIDLGYAVRGGSLSKANFFLDVAATEFCGRGLPKTAYGYPVTVRELYDKPEKLGWREVKGGQDACLAVVPTTGGLIVTETGDTVLYPSAARRQLSVETVHDLGPRPKLLAPMAEAVP